MALLIRNRAYINMFYALGIAARAFIRTAWIKRNANTGRSRSSSVSDIMLVTMPVPPTTLNASQILVCGIPSDYYMETCLEGYGTFFFDRRVLMDAYDRCRRYADMKDNVMRVEVCPLCGKSYHGAPALSRTDNRMYICPDCGTRQTLESIGVDAEEQEQILETIHRHTKP